MALSAKHHLSSHRSQVSLRVTSSFSGQHRCSRTISYSILMRLSICKGVTSASSLISSRESTTPTHPYIALHPTMCRHRQIVRHHIIEDCGHEECLYTSVVSLSSTLISPLSSVYGYLDYFASYYIYLLLPSSVLLTAAYS